jgi:hypothetical protein
MNPSSTLPRNPGPSWGFGFLSWAERWWPQWFFRPMLMAGTWVGLALMPAQRAHSRAYLAVVLGRAPGLGDVWRHFFAFTNVLMLSLRAGRGAPLHCTLEPENAAAFEALVSSGRPALFGTFHFGGSDLLGYLLGERGRHVSIIRLRVRNSRDTGLLGRRFSGRVSFLWINDPASLLFDLKAALEAGNSRSPSITWRSCSTGRWCSARRCRLAGRMNCASSRRRCSRPIRRRTAKPTPRQRGGISRPRWRSWKLWCGNIPSSGLTSCR